MGFPGQALKQNHRAIALAEQLAHPYRVAADLAFGARLHLHRRDVARANECAAACIALSKESGVAYWLVWGNLLFGRVLVEQGQEEDGIRLMR